MIDPGLDGKVVLVTGGATNIGAAISRAFAAQGARVGVHFLGSQANEPEGVRFEHARPSRDEAETFVAGLPGAVGIPQDLSVDGAAASVFERAESLLGPVDVLVNNAAHAEAPDTFQTIDEPALARTYRVNAVAPAMLIAELARSVDRSASGRTASVINISTDAARAFPGQVAYGTSKAALESLTRGAALDLGPRIRVNAVAPGPVQYGGWMSDDLIASVLPEIPLGRVGEPADIADACIFLASQQARWITGQVIQVAGGHQL